MTTVAKLDQATRQTLGRLIETEGYLPSGPGPLGTTALVRGAHSRQTLIFPLDTTEPGGWSVLADNATCIAEGHADVSLWAYDGTEFLLAFSDAAGRASMDLAPFLTLPGARNGETLAMFLYEQFAEMQEHVANYDIADFAWPFFARVPEQITYNGALHWSITIERRGPRGVPDTEPFRGHPVFTIPTIDAPNPAVKSSLQSLIAYEAAPFEPGHPDAYRVPVRFGLNKAAVLVERAVQSAGDTGTTVGERNNNISPYLIPRIE